MDQQSSSAVLFQQYKNRGLTQDELRRRREEEGVQLRKQKRSEQLAKRRHAAADDTNDDDMATNHTPLALTPADAAQGMANLFSDDQQLQLEATTTIRKILSREPNPPIEQVLEAGGVVERLVSLLASSVHSPALQIECAWTLTNIASGTATHTAAVVNAGAVPVFVSLLRPEQTHDGVRDQALWALGNVAGDSPALRDVCLVEGVMTSVVALLVARHDDLPLSMVRNAIWVISNLCRGKNPPPDFTVVSVCLPVLAARLYSTTDADVLTDACWAISHLSDGPNEQIQIVSAALRAVGNIVTGNDSQTQAIIDNGGVHCLHHLLYNNVEAVKKEAIWAFSNITAGSRHQIEAVFAADAFKRIVELMTNAEFKTRKEAAWCVTNAVSGGSVDQVHRLVAAGAIRPLCDLLTVMDARVVQVALNGLENILKCGEMKAKKSVGGVNAYAALVEECGGLDKLEFLQQSQNADVYVKACELHERYFDGDTAINDDNDNLVAAGAAGVIGEATTAMHVADAFSFQPVAGTTGAFQF